MSGTFLIILSLMLIVGSELAIRITKMEWYKKQVLINLIIILLAFIAVFSEGFSQYITWPISILYVLAHLNDFKKMT
ncbi:hypothetical protein CBP51_10075 [Cellvibrio mixtus]|uniref:Uncharacterized protein n=1 Tax=Cellvibrio mixtus TaxID=39650 RepID=A0A266QBR1_9GAMM|nr:hypothetical protein CBP51_10075 [Cellvibrio mixtus]